MSAPTTTTTETVAQVLSGQVVVPTWLRNAVDGLAPTDLVTVTRAHSPVGRHLVRVTPV